MCAKRNKENFLVRCANALSVSSSTVVLTWKLCPEAFCFSTCNYSRPAFEDVVTLWATNLNLLRGVPPIETGPDSCAYTPLHVVFLRDLISGCMSVRTHTFVCTATFVLLALALRARFSVETPAPEFLLVLYFCHRCILAVFCVLKVR